MKLSIYGEGGFQSHDLPDGSCALALGRHSDCDIVLASGDVSRHHARLIVANGIYFIEDTGSSTGTFVDGERIEAATQIEPGQEIQIGSFVLTLGEPQKNEAPPPAPAPSAAPKPPPRMAPPPQPVEVHTDVPAGFEEEFKDVNILYNEETMALTRLIHQDILDKLNLGNASVADMKKDELREKAELNLDKVLKERRHEIPTGLSLSVFRQALLDELVGFGPLSPLLRSSRISEIMVNGPNMVFVESRGKLFNSGVRFFNEQHLISIIQRIVEPLGRHVDEASPMVDARLPDGSRVNAIIPPLALQGAALTVRKFSEKKLTTDDLIAFGSMTDEMAQFLETAVRARQNILVSGGTGSGKTTLLNVLSLFIPQGERVITIEDSAELKLTHPNLVSLEARPANIEGKGRVSIRDLVINTLRMRPDRIIVGECRGPEALDMLQAMNTGHDGSLTTAHANNPRDALTRLENMVMMAGFELPSTAIREQIASALNLIVQQTRLLDGSRKIVKITEVTGREANQILLQDIFTFEQTGLSNEGKVEGYHTATGNIPVFIEDLRRSGRLELDMSVFVPKN